MDRTIMAADANLVCSGAPGTSDVGERPRKAWLAALLSLIGGPVGQVYAGALRRCIVLWAIGVVLFLMVMLSAAWLASGLAAVGILLGVSVGYRIFLIVDACRVAVRNRETPRKAYQTWWVYLLLIVAFHASNWLVAHPMKWCMAEAFVIPTRAMADTILPGDWILVNKLYYHFKPVERGDVIVFYSEGRGSPVFVMRVVAVAGDEIEMRNETVYLNGEAIPEPYVKRAGPMPDYVPEMANFGRTRIPPETVFVLGDNRRLSKDSRFIGSIPRCDVLGKARFIYWSQPRTFPDPYSTQEFIEGPICWERIGKEVR